MEIVASPGPRDENFCGINECYISIALKVFISHTNVIFLHETYYCRAIYFYLIRLRLNFLSFRYYFRRPINLWSGRKRPSRSASAPARLFFSSLLAAIKDVLGDAATDDGVAAWREAYWFLQIFLFPKRRSFTPKRAQDDYWVVLRATV
ncbi:hypothetical protein [Novosphingobium marinum]|uniref:Uncharacterized protein n=1 Tax=Novosphingobium marinum TaxID=1514948 RepID=A0A7Z0BX93_9SPHN|nr:hypothetical protein [Novosphingobium marinum]NYH97190.1 hypothetical protein [Novosphingobium marinum]